MHLHAHFSPTHDTILLPSPLPPQWIRPSHSSDQIRSLAFLINIVVYEIFDLRTSASSPLTKKARNNGASVSCPFTEKARINEATSTTNIQLCRLDSGQYFFALSLSSIFLYLSAVGLVTGTLVGSTRRPFGWFLVLRRYFLAWAEAGVVRIVVEKTAIRMAEVTADILMMSRYFNYCWYLHRSERTHLSLWAPQLQRIREWSISGCT